MKTLFGFLVIVTFVTAIVFLSKSEKQKKNGEEYSKNKKKGLISLGCLVICIVIIGITPDKNSSEDNDETNEASTVTSEESNNADLKKSFNDSLGDTEPTWYESVRNDNTGNWRELVVYSNSSIDKDLAIAYSKGYIKSDDEIHFIVNLKLRTTTRIKKVGNTLSVSCHEYRDNEEHDANELCGGMELEQFNVDIETGELK